VGTPSPTPRRLRDALAAAPADAVGIVRAELRDGSAPADLLRGLQEHAAFLGDAGDLRPLVALDAVWDFLSIFDSDAGRLLEAASGYLSRFPVRPIHPEWLERAPMAERPSVYVGSLDEVLVAPNLETAGARVARILSVVQSPEAFRELLLEAASRDWRAPGRRLVEGNVVVRAMTVRSWREAREILFRLIESWTEADLPPRSPVGVRDPGPIRFDRAFQAAAVGARDFASACLYLAHAFQVERACLVRQRQVRASFRETLEAWFPDLKTLPADWSPGEPEPAGAHGFEDGAALAHALGAGDGEAAAAIALRWSGPDPDVLFRWIAEAILPRLAEGDERPLLLVNGARWGAHLLRGARGPLLSRLLREVSLDAASGAPGPRETPRPTS
jgi:hypothetical protein